MTIEPQQLEFPVSVSQAIFETCIDSVDIQNELYCQLIKQTSPHPPTQHKPSLPVKVGRQVCCVPASHCVCVDRTCCCVLASHCVCVLTELAAVCWPVIVCVLTELAAVCRPVIVCVC